MNTQRFGNQIVTLRNALGMKREELAQTLQLSYGHLNNIELGTRMPSVEVIVALAKCLKVPSGYLFQLLDDEEGSYQPGVDPAKYLAFPDDFSQEDKEEITDFIRFKEIKKQQSRIHNIKDQNIEIKQVGDKRIIEGRFIFSPDNRSSSRKPITINLYLKIERDGQAEAIVTDLTAQGLNTGISVTNASEHLATILVKRFDLDPLKFTMIERYTFRPDMPEYGNTTQSLEKVRFRWNGNEFTTPVFSEVDDEERKRITRDIFKEPDIDDF